jgi:hypothetical protein
MLRKFMIERDIPKVGTLERDQLREAAAKSSSALRRLGPDSGADDLIRSNTCLPNRDNGRLRSSGDISVWHLSDFGNKRG